MPMNLITECSVTIMGFLLRIEMENETLTAENVEIDMETLTDAHRQGQFGYLARWAVLKAVIKALYPEDRKKLEEYRNQ